MFKAILAAVGFLVASFAFQAPATAGVKFDIQFGHGFGHGVHVNKHISHGFKGKRHFAAGHDGHFKNGHGHRRHHNKGIRNHHRGFNKGFHNNGQRRHYVKPHKSYKSHRSVTRHHKPVHGHRKLTNREIRQKLRHKGLYNIRFVDRYRDVAKVIAHNKRGYVARYKVSTHNAKILDGKVLRYQNGSFR